MGVEIAELYSWPRCLLRHPAATQFIRQIPAPRIHKNLATDDGVDPFHTKRNGRVSMRNIIPNAV